MHHASQLSNSARAHVEHRTDEHDNNNDCYDEAPHVNFPEVGGVWRGRASHCSHDIWYV